MGKLFQKTIIISAPTQNIKIWNSVLDLEYSLPYLLKILLKYRDTNNSYKGKRQIKIHSC